MSLKALFYAYLLGGITFIPLVILGVIFFTVYTSVPVGELDADKETKNELEKRTVGNEQSEGDNIVLVAAATSTLASDVNDLPKVRKGWLTVRRTFEETTTEGSYVGIVRGFLDARSKDPKRSRPKDMWYVALKGKVLYLYEDESMTECEAAIELGSYNVAIFPEGLRDGELFARRNAICLRPKSPSSGSEGTKEMPLVTREMRLEEEDIEARVEEAGGSVKQRQKERERLVEAEKRREEAQQEAFDFNTPWFVFVRSNVEMEDWYFSLIHASDNPANSPMLAPLQPVFQPSDMLNLVSSIDEQPDVIPMRWLNALIGRIFFSFYRTQTLESYIIGRLMKKLSKIKRPGFLTDIIVREVSVGNIAPTLSKPMLKELTKEGDASLEVHLQYKGEVRMTVEAIATINLGARFKSYTVKLVLAAVLREIEGNLLIKVKRPPSNRIWYAFTQMPRIVLDVEPVVSDRQITWGMILSTIESRLKEVVQESVVLPNMDDIAFFESSQYMHRGGIWGDASRHERESTLFPTSTAPPDDISVSSAPIAEPYTPLASDVEFPSVHRSQTAREPQITIESSPTASEIAPLTRSAASEIPSSPGGSSLMSKRRTWFGTALTDSTDESGSNIVLTDATDDDAQRGRPFDSTSTITRRSSSTYSNGDSSRSSHSDALLAPESSSESRTRSSSIPPRRASSQHSRASSHHDKSSSSMLDMLSTSAPTESSIAAQRPPTPPIERNTPASPSFLQTRNMPTSPSFLQTLKSRAGDKQALSNTAKEAMRKWGVNWGGLRKESGSNSGGEDPTDADSSEHHRQNDGKAHAPIRPSSYAEVRAAVEHRKEREAHAEDVSGAPSASVPSDPKGKQRGPSASPSNVPTGVAPGYSGGASLTPSSSSNSGPSDATSRLRVVSSPSILPRQRTESYKSQKSQPGEVPADVEPDEPEHPVEPIHTQPPQARTMTIPGIHASHRGEVMSMGYAPPSPVVSPEPKKAPAIQSVYRLWKNPAASSHVQQQRGADSVAEVQAQSGFSGRDQDDPALASGEPETRTVPPRLPPRSASTNALHTTPELPRHRAELDRGSPPASAALQSIATKDQNKRASVEPLVNPPPLPARRVDGNINGDAASGPLPQDATPAGGGAEAGRKPPALPPRRVQASAS